MKRNLTIGLLLPGLAIAALSGCATTQPPGEGIASRASGEKVTKVHCVRDTGSRIKLPEDECLNEPGGRTYSQEELERTGEVDLSEALRDLDPRLQ